MSTNKLVLFTIEFPFGIKESFLETEIIYLSKHFEKVYILPSSSANGSQRNLPENVVVDNRLCNLDKMYKHFKIIKYLCFLIFLYAYSLKHSNKKRNYIKYYGSFFHHLYNDIHKINSIRGFIIEHSLYDALFYDYWLVNSTLSLLFLKRQKIINKVVARGHRFDLYDYEQNEGVVPFVEFKIAELNSIFTISIHGRNYLLEKFGSKFSSKIKNSYLGVPSTSLKDINNYDNSIPTIVSCSSIVPFKRVDRIANILKKVKVHFKWIHIGSGPDFSRIKNIIADFPEHIQVELLGFINNKEIYEFYSSNHINLFISLSESEGLPVSMMEAQSFGIPILGTNVNGVSEIINQATGVLIDLKESDDKIIKSVESIIYNKNHFNRLNIINFFNKNFNAETNYTKFISLLKEL